ncbi:hypothetical protein [Azospirillum sp. INR13]|uniref:hypothetical protein n=1 Tax=Azospirillum sp. INR13 TaxID=2596919 RepID=UPI00189274A5|nr:hypothetical protein [Azospirillum sp. INR13]
MKHSAAAVRMSMFPVLSMRGDSGLFSLLIIQFQLNMFVDDQPVSPAPTRRDGAAPVGSAKLGPIHASGNISAWTGLERSHTTWYVFCA